MLNVRTQIDREKAIIRMQILVLPSSLDNKRNKKFYMLKTITFVR